MALVTTPNLHLPQWTPNEKPSYMVDFNNAFKSIDDSFAGISTKVESANQKATDAMEEAASATSKAQEAMQTANQAQAGLNAHIESLKPSTIILTTTKSTNKNIDIEATLSYNAACATLHILIRYHELTYGPDTENIGTLTLPDNMKIGTSRNRIYLSPCGSGPYIHLEPTAQNNVYIIYAGLYDQYPANSQSANIGTWPASYSMNSRGERILTIVI